MIRPRILRDFTYRARIVDSSDQSGLCATLAVPAFLALFLRFSLNGGTTSIAGLPPFVVEFTGTGGNLALGSTPIAGTVNAISQGCHMGRSRSAQRRDDVTADAGNAIDLAAYGEILQTSASVPPVPIIGAATGVSVIQNAAGSITITIRARDRPRQARCTSLEENTTGTGAILINGSGNVTGTGDAYSGIVAQNLDTADSNNIAVSQTGNITGGYDGIHAVNSGSGNILVTTGANATITGRLRYGIEATSNGTGNVTVTMANAAGDVINSGSVEDRNATTRRAQSLQALVGAIMVTTSTVAVTAYGTINSGILLTGSSSRPAGILAGYRGGTTNTVNGNVYGNVTVDNSANINAAGGDGIRAYNFGNGDVTVNDHAGIITSKDQFGIDAQTNGTGKVLVTTAAGATVNGGSYGIQAINLASVVALSAQSSVSVINNATITGGFHLSPGAGVNQGISAGYFSNNGVSDTSVFGTVSVDNFGNVTSANGYGINAYNWGNGNVTLTDESNTTVSGDLFGLNGFSGSTGAGSSGSVTINVMPNATIIAGRQFNAAGINAFTRNAGNVTVTMGTLDSITSGGYGINAGNQATSATSSSQISVTAREYDQFRL